MLKFSGIVVLNNIDSFDFETSSGNILKFEENLKSFNFNFTL